MEQLPDTDGITTYVTDGGARVHTFSKTGEWACFWGWLDYNVHELHS